MSKTPKPLGGAGFRAGNARRIEPLPWPAADWSLWAFMPKATLRAAVLLSVGLEPSPIRTVRTGDALPMFAEPGPEFQRRLTLACAHLSGHGPLRAIRAMDLLQPDEALVSLPEFRAWAEGLGWPMPEAFPGASAPAPAAGPVPAVAPKTHKTKRRADSLAAVLAEAERNALDSTDWQSAWAALVKLAEPASRPAPLLGYVEGEGVQFRTDDAEQPVGYLKREAFRKRFERKG